MQIRFRLLLTETTLMTLRWSGGALRFAHLLTCKFAGVELIKGWELWILSESALCLPLLTRKVAELKPSF